MLDITVEATVVKIREDTQTEFLIVMNHNLSLSYFNGTAKDIMQFILTSGTCTLKQIFQHMIELYDIDEKILKIDIVDFIRDLQWKKLIKMCA